MLKNTSHYLLLIIILFSIIGCENSKKKSIEKKTILEKNKIKINSKKNINNINIVLITIDTLRFDRLSTYSDKYVQTPNIDKIAKKSIIFNRAFAHNPLTLPSHINILTGTYPLYHGISDNTRYKLDDKFLTIAELLKSNNYKTAAFIGAFPLDSRFGLDQGFDLYDDNYGSQKDSSFMFVERSAERVIDPAIKWISRQKSKWFTWLHFFEPHQPYVPPAPFKERYKDDLYSGEVAYLDHQLGEFFDFLQDQNYSQNTIIIITSDHGEALGEKGERTHGYFAYNNTIHVPLIIYIPGKQFKLISENVGHIDLFPTICEQIGISIPKHIQGKSLIPLISGEKLNREGLYFESLSPYLNIGWAPLRGIVKDNIKFIDLPIPEIYNLKKDPMELNNIINDTKSKSLKRILKKLIAKNSNKVKLSRLNKLDKKTIKTIESLGYISGGRSVSKKKLYKETDDLKKLLPIYNKTYSAMAYFHKGDIDKSINMLSDVLLTHPMFSLVYKNLAMIYTEQGKTKDALSILEKGLKVNPDDIMLLSKFGILLSKSGNYKQAISVLKKCIKLEDFNPDIYNHLGIAYYKLQNLDLALRNYSLSIELDPDNTAAYLNRGIIYLTKFYISKDRSSLPAAILNFKKVIEFDPKIVKNYLLLSTSYKRNGEINKAISCLNKGLEVNIDNGSLLVELGIAYLDMGNNKKALEFFHKFKSLYLSKMSDKNKMQIQQLIDKAKANSNK